jgi:CHAT domain-containing protein
VNILSLRGRFFLVIFIFFILGCSKAELTKKLLIQADNYAKKNEYVNTAETFEKLIKVLESDSSKESINYMKKNGFISMAYIYKVIGDIYFGLNRYDKALLYFNKEKQSVKKEYSSKYLQATYLAQSNQNIAKVYIKLGQRKKAIKILNNNLKKFPFLHPLFRLKDYIYLKYLYTKTPIKLNRLKFILNELLKIRNEFISKTAIRCSIDNHIGEIYIYLKEYKKSKSYFKTCLSIAEKQYKKKLDYKENSYLIYGLLGKPSLDLITPNFNLGLLYVEQKNFKKANEYFKKAFKATKIQPPFISEIEKSDILFYRGIMEFLLKNYNKSLSLFKKAKKYRQDSKGNNSLLYEYIAIANVLDALNKIDKSYEYIQKAYSLFLKNRNRNFKILDDKGKRIYIDTIKYSLIEDALLPIGYRYTIKNKNAKQTMLNNWLKYKGTIFEYQNILSTIYHNTSDKRVKNSIDKLKRLTIELDNLDNSDIKPKKYNEIKESIEEKIHNIEVNLSKENQRFKEQLDLKNIDYKEIAKNLKDNQLYIDFAKGKDNYYIFTLDNRENITFKQIDKNQTEAINKNIKEFLDINKKIAENINNQKLIRELKPKTDKILSKLYNLLIDKNIEDKKEIDRLIISSDGIINFLPFETLFDGKNYLIEKYTISYISSGREFIRQIKRKNSSNHNKIVIFANMDFQLELPPKEKDTKKGIDNITIFDIDSLSKLDATEEIKAIKSNFKNIKIYQEENATVENIFKIKSPKILHISTHGVYLNNKNILNPMRRSALAFSGADNASYIGDARGFATALKLSSLDLEGTELVVLSACESGLGVVQEAEGVIGLPKAFIQAGAKNVVISLWKVSNNKSALLMKYFYDNIAKGKDYTTALRDAKLKMLSLHPYFWGAFIIYGI